MKKLILLTILVASAQITYSQEVQIENWCGTAKKMNDYKSSAANRQLLVEQELLKEQEQLNGPIAPKGVIRKIPIVFHILHNGGSENVSEEQIFNALDVLNRDFRLQNADTADVIPLFKPLYADVEIEFVLATKAPNGACFRGYTRTQSATSFVGSDGDAQVDAIVAGNDVFNGQWPGNKYLNVFVVGDAGGAGGYTTKPGFPYNTSMKNGIWILNNQFGEIGTSNLTAGRSLTHECGHWFDLSHTWGDGNQPGCDGTATSSSDPCWNTVFWAGPIGPIDNCATDDGVPDTPQCIGSAGACNVAENSCGPIANVQNYMDYALSCQSMFTAGQVVDMQAAVNSSTGGRSSLWTVSNLNATGANGVLELCNAEFSADRTSVCAGDAVQFTDETFNAATGWTWTFTGGTPSASAVQDPLITYNTPGLYEVSLFATDGTNDDTEIKTAYIRVLPSADQLPFLEDFESFATLSNIEDWEVINQSGSAEWMLETAVGQTGTHSAKIMNFGQAIGSYDELVSAPVDLSGITGSATLSFRYAYKRKNSSDDDYLRVYATADCGQNWDLRKTMHGIQLSTQTQGTAFTPSSWADWTTVHITNLINTYWVDNFRCKFTFEAGGGNNYFLDNINIYEGSPSDNLVIGLSEGELVNDLSVYPNPTDNELNVRFTVSGAHEVYTEIQDISGKIAQRNIVQANGGSNVIVYSTDKLASGVYFLKLSVGGTNKVVQFIVK